MAEPNDIITRVAETLKEPVEISRDLDERVMAQIRADTPPAPARPGWRAAAARWLRQPTIQLTPLGGLAAAAMVAAVGVGAGRMFPAAPPDLAGPPAVAASATSTIEFVLVAPGAESVSLVGDFNDWDLAATPLQPGAGDGVWSVTVPLAPGRYRYSFLVDGTIWRKDPNRAPAVEDEFGRPNSVVTIGGAL